VPRAVRLQGVGKSTIMARYTAAAPPTSPTIGVEFGTRATDVVHPETGTRRIKAQIWDTAGQERYQASATSSSSSSSSPPPLVFV
jgi:GTPase SAR1 family protein